LRKTTLINIKLRYSLTTQLVKKVSKYCFTRMHKRKIKCKAWMISRIWLISRSALINLKIQLRQCVRTKNSNTRKTTFPLRLGRLTCPQFIPPSPLCILLSASVLRLWLSQLSFIE
jgi:hypothetical protein